MREPGLLSLSLSLAPSRPRSSCTATLLFSPWIRRDARTHEHAADPRRWRGTEGARPRRKVLAGAAGRRPNKYVRTNADTLAECSSCEGITPQSSADNLAPQARETRNGAGWMSVLIVLTSEEARSRLDPVSRVSDAFGVHLPRFHPLAL
jgi:hypothetical protein